MIALLGGRAAKEEIVSLISLDYDLRNLRGPDGKARHAGTGMDVADWLAGRRSTCPVIVHTSSGHAARAMVSRMEASGMRPERIAPRGGLDWVEASWLPAVLEVLFPDGA
jgi:hypothetical protein